MATAKDFLITESGDLAIRNGDFVLIDSDNQNVLDIIVSSPGWWREYPTCGVGIQNYQSSSGQTQSLEATVKVQLENDGFSVQKLQAIPVNEQFTIKANVVRNL